MSKKSGLANEIIKLTARLPWWVGVLLAVASYWGLHRLAGIDVPTATKAADAGPMVIWQFVKVAGKFLQYAVPPLCLIGVLVSVLSRRRRNALGVQVASGARAVEDLSWLEFERLVGAWFEQRGFRVTETSSGADGGIDLYATRDSERVLVQCKHWRARKVGVEPVRELYGLLAASGSAGAYLVTSGTFTQAAREFARGREIQLIDGAELRKALVRAPTSTPSQVANRQAPSPASANSQSDSPLAQPLSAVTPPPTPQVLCPKCGARMVERVAKTGTRAGQRFWGCSTFPTCRGVRESGAGDSK